MPIAAAATQIGAPHNIVEVGDDHLILRRGGVGLFIVSMNAGTERMPARPVFELLEEDEELVMHP